MNNVLDSCERKHHGIMYDATVEFDGAAEESHESVSQSRSLGPPEYEAGMLPTRLHEVVWLIAYCSVNLMMLRSP